ncbi:MAG: rhomboid family intramembrane serine protease [Verrucomicrobiota bacterium]|nr:rhomboid family intramembrane serine protease [Verrucomicrobiota bacterium]
MRLSGRKIAQFTRTWSPAPRVVLLSLIGANVGAFLVQLVLDSWNPDFTAQYLGLSHDGVSNAYAWQFFSALTLCHSPWQFFLDLGVLYLIGRDVDTIIGQRQLLFLYLFGAFAGELGHLFLMPTETVLFAASGGVAAVFAAYATILPELELSTLLLFVVPVRLKIRRAAHIVLFVAVVLMLFDRRGVVGHSAYLGGALAGFLYAHVLGFGRTSFIQRALRQRRLETARLQEMTPERFLAEEIDPLLEKISRRGMHGLSRRERRLLELAREKMISPADG